MPITLHISKPLPRGVSQDILDKAASITIKRVGSEANGTIELSFVGKAKSRQLNKTYAGNDYPTDVLSFDYREQSQLPNSELIGEIVICTDLAYSQAQEYNLPFKAEVSLLLIHGILHILKLDHQDESGRARFSSLQDGIMLELAFKSRQFKWLH